uniref:Putative ovule protein n=1 Tax=Solanum chacoense TaxID=4108 RepID=A0A0V0H348_SOLCH
MGRGLNDCPIRSSWSRVVFYFMAVLWFHEHSCTLPLLSHFCSPLCTYVFGIYVIVIKSFLLKHQQEPFLCHGT